MIDSGLLCAGSQYDFGPETPQGEMHHKLQRLRPLSGLKRSGYNLFFPTDCRIFTNENITIFTGWTVSCWQ
jgi:hypothetical protein